MTTNAMVNPGELREALLAVIHCAPNGISEGTLRELVLRQDVGRPAVPDLYANAGSTQPQDRLRASLNKLQRHANVRYEDGTFYPTGVLAERRTPLGVAAVRRNEILTFLADGPKTTAEISAHTGLVAGSVQNYTRELIAEGKIEYSERAGGHGRNYFLPGAATPSRRRRLIDLAHLFPGTAREIAEAVDAEPGSIGDQLYKWHKQGRLRRERIMGIPGPPRFRYFLSDSEEVAA